MSLDAAIAKSELQKIRSMTADEFEQAFELQLRNERKQTLLTVYFMKEADRRRDWTTEYGTFRDYCIKKMKMSDSDFYRKHEIMKTLDEMPEIQSKLIDGSLNQATLSKAIQFLNKEARLEQRLISKQEKRELFAQIENLNERQVQKELTIKSPAKPDATVFNQRLDVRTDDQTLEAKLERLRDLLAPLFQTRPSEHELMHAIADIALEKLDPEFRDKRKAKRDRVKARVPARVVANSNRSAPTAAMKREVRQRCENKCAHVSLLNGETCGSRLGLEVDHIVPITLGGSTTLENLRLVCRTHNQRYTMDKLGRNNMARYLNSLR